MLAWTAVIPSSVGHILWTIACTAAATSFDQAIAASRAVHWRSLSAYQAFRSTSQVRAIVTWQRQYDAIDYRQQSIRVPLARQDRRRTKCAAGINRLDGNADRQLLP